MKARLTVFVLLIVALISVAVVASAITIPTVKESGAPEPPQIPTMKCKNDGVTQTVTMSEPIDWIASIWNWEWFEMKFDNEEHTQASVSMEGHHAAQGWGIWVSSDYDEEGNVTWTGTGVYGEEGHPYAYDVSLPNGANVKYGTHGNPVEITIDDYAGSSYFDNGKSRLTKYIYKGGTNCVDQEVIYLYQLQESYADGSFIRTTYAMNGEPTYAFLMTKDKDEIILYDWDPEEEEAEEPAEVPAEGLVLFEGENTVAWGSWDGWQDNNVAVDLKPYKDQLNALEPGQKIAVTYMSNNTPCILIQPSAGEKSWSWNQLESPDQQSTSGDSKVAIYTYDTIVDKVGALDQADYAYYAVYGWGQDITVTKVEILPAE